MFDFRYHAISIAGVIVALVIGLLLGVAIGDENLVSSAQRDLSNDLVKRARAENRTLREELTTANGEKAQRERYEKETLPALVQNELPGRKVAVLFLHDDSRSGLADISEVVRDAGGELGWVGTLHTPVDLGQLAGAAPEDSRYTALADDDSLVTPFAQRVGAQLIDGGKLVKAVRNELLSSFSGEIGGIGAIVVVRREPKDQSKEDATAEERFVSALLDGMTVFSTPAVGAEQTQTDPSQVRWYRTHDLSSVDDVNLPAGQAALVFALAGEAEGAYGVKGTADALLPDALTRPGG